MQKKIKKINILAPISGKIIKISKKLKNIPKKRYTIVIIPNNNIIVSPYYGKIKKICFKKYLISIKLIHNINITITLQIKIKKKSLKNKIICFMIYKSQNIYPGEVIIMYLLSSLNNWIISITTVIDIQNTNNIKKIKTYSGYSKAGISKIITIIQ